MTKKVIFEMNIFEVIDWVNNHPLTMVYLYALEKKGILGGNNDNS